MVNLILIAKFEQIIDRNQTANRLSIHALAADNETMIDKMVCKLTVYEQMT